MNKQDIRQFFDRCADTWDEELMCNDEKMERILTVAGVGEGASVLDIACGTGVMFPYYLQRGAARITGVDISEKMTEKASAKQFPRTEVLCADAEEYPFSRQYDCCMIFNAFPHFCNPAGLFENLRRALKPGGSLTVAHDRGKKAIDAHHHSAAQEVSCGLMDAGELAELMTACGFTVSCTVSEDDIYIVTGRKS